MHLCIGIDDELTQQVAQDLQRLKRAEPATRLPYDRSISYRKFIAMVTQDKRTTDASLATH
ncbi:MAG: hypothetical protein CO066_15040 [Comamonadaceae bacterium CG_4_9_14_0_8_um_filter_60_18]|nr:MAG: hypothetical protein AUK52_04025 [Comamonadaceae bacterium CG2_30_60_41]PIW09038.1 MAG: hypothetical protein COW39_07190 [Comamonadaceae bacterium CG17_big_fil_post_rev_8_21_14_2_50_60_13]PIY26374.1 MAG: hypothetical protein COZ10_02685 [Comamonadaceae bacterium CG_4_10_14_3_um_filter_60_75]PJC11541.1 MAG: hypothetical protein CO066_15040 [Comamonadaceae bacterium CG_4_9_14_0_8_um_filter_60_18]